MSYTIHCFLGISSSFHSFVVVAHLSTDALQGSPDLDRAVSPDRVARPGVVPHAGVEGVGVVLVPEDNVAELVEDVSAASVEAGT